VDQQGDGVTSPSRSGLPEQLIALQRVTLENLDRLARASRAGLIADFRMALRTIESIVGQSGTAEAVGHAPSPNG
jgi:hypothetical protein